MIKAPALENRGTICRWQRAADEATRSWWFFVAVVALQLLPLFASRGYDLGTEWPEVAGQAIRHPVFAPAAPWPTVFKVVPLALIALAILRPRIGSRLFAAYVAANCVGFIMHQTVGYTERYGLVINTTDFSMFCLVAAAWAWEFVTCRNDFAAHHCSSGRLWIVPVALLAFWYPLNPETARPDFSLDRFVGNGAGLAFCTMTPLYLAVLICGFPGVNFVTLRVMSLIGVVAGLWNLYLNFVADPDVLWWNGVLHLPLLAVSTYGLLLSSRREVGLPPHLALR